MRPWTNQFVTDPDDPAFAEYLDACEQYYLRQLVVYEHWPPQGYGGYGSKAKRNFVDPNN